MTEVETGGEAIAFTSAGPVIQEGRDKISDRLRKIAKNRLSFLVVDILDVSLENEFKKMVGSSDIQGIRGFSRSMGSAGLTASAGRTARSRKSRVSL